MTDPISSSRLSFAKSHIKKWWRRLPLRIRNVLELDDLVQEHMAAWLDAEVNGTHSGAAARHATKRLVLRAKKYDAFVFGEYRPVKDPSDGRSSYDCADVLMALATIPPHERRVLELRFGIGSCPLSRKDIAIKFGVTYELVRLYEKRAIKRIRQNLETAEALSPDQKLASKHIVEVLKTQTERLNQKKALKQAGKWRYQRKVRKRTRRSKILKSP